MFEIELVHVAAGAAITTDTAVAATFITACPFSFIHIAYTVVHSVHTYALLGVENDTKYIIYVCNRKEVKVFSIVSFSNLAVLHINRMDVIVCRHIKNGFLVQHSIGILQFNWLLHVCIDFNFIA